MPSDTVVHLSDTEIATILRTLLNPSKRVQCVALANCSVWIKRYGTETPGLWMFLQRMLAKVIPIDFLRPSPVLPAALMVEREARRIEQFSCSGFPTPRVLYRSGNILILTDSGSTIATHLKALRSNEPEAHDALLIHCAAELGKLHAAGLCHGRPHPRDFTLQGDHIGYLDFEEEPDAVMSLAAAQARDMLLLCLQIGSLAVNGTATLSRAFEAWSAEAPASSVRYLARIAKVMRLILPLARVVRRFGNGADVQRFVTAMTFLCYVQT